MQQLRQLIPQEVCLKCDVCCRFSQEASPWAPVLSNAETVKIEEEKPAKVLDNNQFQLIPTRKGFLCPYFSVKDNGCQIYSIRPFQCQLYPFLLNKNGQKITLCVDLKCPFIYKGIEAGILKKDLAFSRHIQYLTNLFNSKNIIDLIIKNPQLIGDFSEDIIILANLERLSHAIFRENQSQVKSAEA